MKKIVLTFVSLFCVLCVSAHNEDSTSTVIVSDSVPSVQELITVNVDSVSVLNLPVNPRFRLYPTKNMWTFIELDTRTGRMYQVQYHIGKDSDKHRYRYRAYLGSPKAVNYLKASDSCNGRFSLHLTENVYNLILIDQIDGDVWQVQWGEEDERLVLKIDDL